MIAIFVILNRYNPFFLFLFRAHVLEGKSGPIPQIRFRESCRSENKKIIRNGCRKRWKYEKGISCQEPHRENEKTCCKR